MTFLETFFSVKNSEKHKIITILGIKIKFKSKKLNLKKELIELRRQLDYLSMQNFINEAEIKSLLKNYKNFAPVTNKIKVFLLNDTSRDLNHLGTATVQKNIKHLCEKNGAEIYYSDACFPQSPCKKEYEDIIKHCDILLLNGEGTLHDNAALSLYEKCKIAKELGKKVILINTVWQNNSPEYEQYLKIFDLICCRESFSFQALPDFVKHKACIVPDLTFYGQPYTNKNTKSKILFTDSVLPNVTNLLFDKAKEYKSEFYYMIGEDQSKCLNEDIFSSMNSSSRIITGRFHALTFGIKYGIPTLAIPSNTYKIEGLLKDANLDMYIIKNMNAIDEEILNFIHQPENLFTVRARKYREYANLEIDKLFENIFKMVNKENN